MKKKTKQYSITYEWTMGHEAVVNAKSLEEAKQKVGEVVGAEHITGGWEVAPTDE